MKNNVGLALLVAAALTGPGCSKPERVKINDHRGVIELIDYVERGINDQPELTVSHREFRDGGLRVYHAYTRNAKEIYFAFAEGDTASLWYGGNGRVEAR